MNIKVLVATHKPGFVVSHEQYLPIHVGKALSSADLRIQADNEGGNKCDQGCAELYEACFQDVRREGNGGHTRIRKITGQCGDG